ncbi:hypothetical protein RF11_12587 [Thelohanellus kitauei]|uniref:Uncharacterized protein n=1 Tax=Thelohanellus kitauei TaxID=669202 RepID=A0A0C2IUV1_THEKT|nr:hypothetical protein RF11_12587 [Thelohanellus kitauei]
MIPYLPKETQEKIIENKHVKVSDISFGSEPKPCSKIKRLPTLSTDSLDENKYSSILTIKERIDSVLPDSKTQHHVRTKMKESEDDIINPGDSQLIFGATIAESSQSIGSKQIHREENVKNSWQESKHPLSLLPDKSFVESGMQSNKKPENLTKIDDKTAAGVTVIADSKPDSFVQITKVDHPSSEVNISNKLKDESGSKSNFETSAQIPKNKDETPIGSALFKTPLPVKQNIIDLWSTEPKATYGNKIDPTVQNLDQKQTRIPELSSIKNVDTDQHEIKKATLPSLDFVKPDEINKNIFGQNKIFDGKAFAQDSKTDQSDKEKSEGKESLTPDTSTADPSKISIQPFTSISFNLTKDEKNRDQQTILRESNIKEEAPKFPFSPTEEAFDFKIATTRMDVNAPIRVDFHKPDPKAMDIEFSISDNQADEMLVPTFSADQNNLNRMDEDIDEKQPEVINSASDICPPIMTTSNFSTFTFPSFPAHTTSNSIPSVPSFGFGNPSSTGLSSFPANLTSTSAGPFQTNFSSTSKPTDSALPAASFSSMSAFGKFPSFTPAVPGDSSATLTSNIFGGKTSSSQETNPFGNLTNTSKPLFSNSDFQHGSQNPFNASGIFNNTATAVSSSPSQLQGGQASAFGTVFTASQPSGSVFGSSFGFPKTSLSNDQQISINNNSFNSGNQPIFGGFPSNFGQTGSSASSFGSQANTNGFGFPQTTTNTLGSNNSNTNPFGGNQTTASAFGGFNTSSNMFGGSPTNTNGFNFASNPQTINNTPVGGSSTLFGSFNSKPVQDTKPNIFQSGFNTSISSGFGSFNQTNQQQANTGFQGFNPPQTTSFQPLSSGFTFNNTPTLTSSGPSGFSFGTQLNSSTPNVFGFGNQSTDQPANLFGSQPSQPAGQQNFFTPSTNQPNFQFSSNTSNASNPFSFQSNPSQDAQNQNIFNFSGGQAQTQGTPKRFYRARRTLRR